MATANSPGASSNNNADSDVEDINPNLIFQLIIAIDFLYLLLSTVPLPSASSASLVTPLQALLWAPSSATLMGRFIGIFTSCFGSLRSSKFNLFLEDALHRSLPGSGLIKRKGVKGSFGEAGSCANVSVWSTRLVVCFLKRLRGKDDVINAGVAGCCTSLALSFPAYLFSLVVEVVLQFHSKQYCMPMMQVTFVLNT
ncbi:hypothetical protein DKX38_017435 [Salix brachista]|uniref:Uncharacterized protein n=1 Tax=Salix brachista TaxID=2182728 RepID=A0A5N5KVA0_9ROSI|nr:hypothetical protein DKX38_017435 [Salix brachista]